MKRNRKRRGGMMIEYVVIAAIVVAAIIFVVNFLMDKVKDKAEATGTMMDGADFTSAPGGGQQAQ
jgi:Flp pilus assembly pilin Flp